MCSQLCRDKDKQDFNKPLVPLSPEKSGIFSSILKYPLKDSQSQDVVHLDRPVSRLLRRAGRRLREITTAASWKDDHGNRCVHERKVSVNG